MEQEFTATVVRIGQQAAEILLIELESTALKDDSPFELISARLSLDQTGASVGSRLAVTIAAGDKMQLIVRPESQQGDQIDSGRPGSNLAKADTLSSETSKWITKLLLVPLLTVPAFAKSQDHAFWPNKANQFVTTGDRSLLKTAVGSEAVDLS